jgi:hypothetical protein
MLGTGPQGASSPVGTTGFAMKRRIFTSLQGFQPARLSSRGGLQPDEGSASRAQWQRYFFPGAFPLGVGAAISGGAGFCGAGDSCTGGSAITFLKNAYGTFAVSTASFLS